eukprot:gene2649-6747_t
MGSRLITPAFAQQFASKLIFPTAQGEAPAFRGTCLHRPLTTIKCAHMQLDVLKAGMIVAPDGAGR